MELLNQAIEDARARYISANPLSLAADKQAERYMPGGNTRRPAVREWGYLHKERKETWHLEGPGRHKTLDRPRFAEHPLW